MTAVTTWRYYLPSENGEGWAVIFMDSVGVFSAVTDWGEYSYFWCQPGWQPHDPDFRRFILERSDGYLAGKLTREEVYDAEATLAAVKAHIEDCRRDGDLSAEDAETETDAIEDCENLRDREAFVRWMERTTVPEPWRLSASKPHPQGVQFMARVMPRLREAIREELAREAEAAVTVEKLKAAGPMLREAVRAELSSEMLKVPNPEEPPAIEPVVAEADPDLAKAEADAQYWMLAATAVGYNDLATRAPLLGEKVYFRLFRDRAEKALVDAGHKPIFAHDEGAITLPAPPHIRFKPSDLESLREVVKALEAAQAGKDQTA